MAPRRSTEEVTNLTISVQTETIAPLY
ncbi:hypothetical protein CCACVL1_04343 [Corchorus capsularis]|uniref:Uncharacterized protein n=1 Tax=Corchorus capsularis TaxID=210143 RepID=A0A1R3JT73_COCAP|nr:hypothetical protein CCACVL1_04343 [Corchorus capsularis]